MKKLLVLLFMVQAVYLMALPYNGNIVTFKQPDGSAVDVRLYGNEYYMRAEGLDGYTVVRDKKSQWICYATLSAGKSELLSTGVVYRGKKGEESTLRSDLNMPLHLDISRQAREKAESKNMALLGATEENNIMKHPQASSLRGTPIHLVSGSIKGLCLVVDFSDQPGNLPMSEFEAFCNDLNYTNFGNKGSLRTFYSDISGGLLDYENVVYGYFRAPQTFAAYDSMPYAVGAQIILGLALEWVESQGFDFSTLTTNPDGSIVAINLMYTGVPPNWAQGMWHHKGYYGSFTADGVRSGDYNCSPANDPLALAVVAHENGHMIGKWPDTYKYSGTTGPDGIGAFDLMCWYGDYNNPVPPNPLFRSNAGWGKVVDVTDYNGINIDTANSGTCYLYRNINNDDEFFLIENRRKTGRSQFIPDEGLTIWHINRLGDNQSTDHEVYLEHANNDITNHSRACFHSGFRNEFGATTSPNSDFYSGSLSGLRVWEIGSRGDTMHYKLGLGAPQQVLRMAYKSFEDQTGDGYIEAGESADIEVRALNIGQLNSDTAVVSCTAVGGNAGYVTVNTAPVKVGVIDINGSVDLAFNITVHADAPIGTEIQLKFEVSDGIDSSFVIQSFLTGIVLTMDNAEDTICSAVFYDEGGPGNYNSNTHFIKNIFPGTPGKTIQVNFISFDVEEETNCSYDYLKIYDGPTLSSPLIGTYCGTNSPGIITSTDPSGGLLFEFHSDEAATASGWIAEVSCQDFVSVSSPGDDSGIQVYPNPSGGIIHIRTNTNDPVEFSVLNILGSEVMSRKSSSSPALTVDLSDKPAGIYLLKLKYGSREYTKRVILNK